jgi:hypothetical protein
MFFNFFSKLFGQKARDIVDKSLDKQVTKESIPKTLEPCNSESPKSKKFFFSMYGNGFEAKEQKVRDFVWLKLQLSSNIHKKITGFEYKIIENFVPKKVDSIFYIRNTFIHYQINRNTILHSDNSITFLPNSYSID